MPLPRCSCPTSPPASSDPAPTPWGLQAAPRRQAAAAAAKAQPRRRGDASGRPPGTQPQPAMSTSPLPMPLRAADLISIDPLARSTHGEVVAMIHGECCKDHRDPACPLYTTRSISPVPLPLFLAAWGEEGLPLFKCSAGVAPAAGGLPCQVCSPCLTSAATASHCPPAGPPSNPASLLSGGV